MPNKLTVREWRRLRELTMEQAADAIGVHVNTYRAWERNPQQIPIGKAQKLAEFLNVDFSDVIFLHG